MIGEAINDKYVTGYEGTAQHYKHFTDVYRLDSSLTSNTQTFIVSNL